MSSVVASVGSYKVSKDGNLDDAPNVNSLGQYYGMYSFVREEDYFERIWSNNDVDIVVEVVLEFSQ